MHAATAINEASGLPFEEADDMMKDIKDDLVSREALTADHEDIERLIAETIFGEVTVTRRLYQVPGAEGLAPMDAALNLPAEHYSHGVRRFVAEECARLVR